MKSYALRPRLLARGERAAEVVRFVVNGVFATGVHFSVLTFALEVMHIPLAAAANAIAAIFGITVSFLGNRYFVFRNHTETIFTQATRFTGVYVTIAFLHAGVLLVLTDWLKIDFRIGFACGDLSAGGDQLSGQPAAGLRKMKLLSALILTVVYIVLLLGIYVVHAWYLPVPVVFYSAMLDAVLAAAVMAVGMVALRWARRTLGGFERLLLVVIWLLGGYAYAISVPTVLDRSLSFYILEKLQQRGGGIEELHMADVFVREYMPEFRLVDVRLTEQLQSGTIIIKNGCVMLTPRGQFIASVSSYIRAHLLPKKRLLMGAYTDALDHPFENSPKGKQGYECHQD